MKNIFTKKALIPLLAITIFFSMAPLAMAYHIKWWNNGTCDLTDGKKDTYHGTSHWVEPVGGKGHFVCKINGEYYSLSIPIGSGGTGEGDGMREIVKYFNSVFSSSVSAPMLVE